LGEVGVTVAPAARAAATGSLVIGNLGGLDLGMAPRTMIDDQHGQHAENCNGGGDHDGAANRSLRTILFM